MHYGHIHSQLGGFFVVLLAVLGLFTGGTGATSHESAPWKQVHAPENPKLRLARGVQPFQPQGTLAQRSLQQSTDLRHDDTFLLKFQVDGDAFSVIFKPSQNLIHPEARVHYSGSETPQRLRARDVRAYQGVVVQEAVVEQYWAEEVAGLVRPQSDPAVRGWARLLVRDDDEAWDGSMHVHGIRYHFKPVHRFIKESHQRHQRDGTAPLDPPLPALARRNLLGGNTVVLRSVDSDSHEQQSTAECAHDASPFNLQLSQKTAHTRRHPDIPPFFGRDSDVFSPFGSTPLIKRQGDMAGGDGNSSFEGSIGSTAGCPTENRVVYIGVAADCNAVQSLDSQDEARIQLLSYINSVSGIYQSAFNISLGVVELNVKDASCPSSAPSDEPWNVSCDADNSPDLNQRLSLFSQWRSDKGGGDGAGLWHLITTCTTSSEVGVAWLGQLCKVDASPSGSGETTSGTGVTSITQNTFEVIAHEIGHNFGAIHDCASGCSPASNTQSNGATCCPLSADTCNAESNFIMSPVAEKNTTDFSPCTIGNVCSQISDGLNTTCLYVPGDRSTLSVQQCGNGIIEPGEECDPGESGQSDCCTSDCKLQSGADCDPSNQSCCTDDCQYANSGVVCRPSINSDCDPEETCSGDSGDCPKDKHEDNGKSCGKNDDLQCAAGKCTSRDQQCKERGSSLGIKKACDTNQDTCQMTCANPDSGRSCLLLDSYFSDGLPCGLAGTCEDGSCNEGSLGDRIKNWITKNKQYSIPIIVVGSIVVLLVLYSLLRCCFSRARGQPVRVAPSAAYLTGRSRGGNRRQSNRNSARPVSVSGGLMPPPPQHPYMRQNSAEGPASISSSTPQQSYRPPSQPPPPPASEASPTYAPPPGPPPPQ